MWITLFGGIGSGCYYCITHSYMVQIYSTDSVFQMAEKIYHKMEVNASVCIYGFVTGNEEVIPKGQLVVEQIKKLYENEYMSNNGAEGQKRKFQYRNNSVGGPIMHPIFSWEKRIVEGQMRYTIWRVQ